MERVHPPALNYDNILPLAVESRSNRRSFPPTNGDTFGNANGATTIRIDVNADSMLDCSHSYLNATITNGGGVTSSLFTEQCCPSWIQRLRIESGGVVIEDINEYARLYAMMSLLQCPTDYIMNNMTTQGLYQKPIASSLNTGGGGGVVNITSSMLAQHTANTASAELGVELTYPQSAQLQLSGVDNLGAIVANNAANQPTAGGLVNHRLAGANAIVGAGTRTMSFPLLSGFLNMDKYLPLIMMNAGFTIEIHLHDALRVGVTQTETAAAQGAIADSVWTISNVDYVAHLIDLDRSFYERLRAVMESTGGVLQLAGQTYRHFTAQTPVGQGPHTISIPARVKSVKSIFATFIDSTQVGINSCYDSSVFQNANISSFRFEIGSVRYPQRDVRVSSGGVAGADKEYLVELQKSMGKLGDYQHQTSFSFKHCLNAEIARTPNVVNQNTLSSFILGYDFESFQRVALEAGINTADRSLPINFIFDKTGATAQATRIDVYVLCDAIYFINLDGTVSVSV